MNLLVAYGAKSHKILGDVISQSAPRLNVVNLKIFHSPRTIDIATDRTPEFSGRVGDKL
jgi:hypothetical protein